MLERLSTHANLLLKSIFTIIKIPILTHFFRRYSAKKSRNQSCVILTNGPSLTKLILEKSSFLNEKELFCVNYFANTAYFEQLKPAYYVLAAPEFFIQDVLPEYIENANQLFENIATKTTWKLTLYVPALAARNSTWKKSLLHHPYVQIKYFNTTPTEGYRWLRHFIYRTGWGMPRPHNILIPSLMIAINSGFTRVYLWGADHSWLPELSVTDENVVLLAQKHFYDENSAKPQVMHKLGKGHRKLHEILQKFVYSFSAYFDIDEYAKTRKSHIINQTPGSFIDAFERELF